MAKQTFEEKFAAALPLSVYQTFIRRDVISFVYHQVSPHPSDHIRHIYPVKTPQEFEQDLIYLRKNYNPISYEQLLRFYQAGERLPPNAALVSFDDGYRECFTESAPLLLKHKVPCIFFLTTGLLDNREMFYRNKYSLCAEAILNMPPGAIMAVLNQINAAHDTHLANQESFLAWLGSLKYSDEIILDHVVTLLKVDIQGYLENAAPYLTRDQVRDLAMEGFEIGAHSVHHPKFVDLGQAAIKAEILKSCEAVSSLTGKPNVPFAFPFSGLGVDRSWLAALKSDHPVLGLLFETQGLRPEPPFVINRIWADPPATPPGGSSNLDQIIHKAYQEYLIWRRRYYASMVAYKLGRR